MFFFFIFYLTNSSLSTKEFISFSKKEKIVHFGIIFFIRGLLDFFFKRTNILLMLFLKKIYWFLMCPEGIDDSFVNFWEYSLKRDYKVWEHGICHWWICDGNWEIILGIDLGSNVWWIWKETWSWVCILSGLRTNKPKINLSISWTES